jgi:AbrB family looped-hinge helix DNA binding protein
MKKYPKLVQCDKRGQIVIPKDVRDELDLEIGAGFFVYTIGDEGILLKKVPVEPLQGQKVIEEIKNKAGKIGLNKKKLEKAESEYKVITRGKLKEV